MARRILGKYIIADPKICQGKPTFIGTRVMVWQVLEQLAEGMPRASIVKAWRGRVNEEAIGEALQLAHRVLEGRERLAFFSGAPSEEGWCGEGGTEDPVTDRRVLGKYIVADPHICHGKPTFIGTRLMVWQVLYQVARATPWDKIIEMWPHAVSREAIAEAVELASKTWLNQVRVYPIDWVKA